MFGPRGGLSREWARGHPVKGQSHETHQILDFILGSLNKQALSLGQLFIFFDFSNNFFFLSFRKFVN